MYLYRPVNKAGNTVDFLLTERRNKRAAHLFLLKAINNNGKPLTINIDTSGINNQAIRTYNKRTLSNIRIRQCKYLNNRIEGNHPFIKWRTQNRLGFKSFESTSRTCRYRNSTNDKKGTSNLSNSNCLLHLLLFGCKALCLTGNFLSYFTRCDRT
jgi:transposase-like protein